MATLVMTIVGNEIVIAVCDYVITAAVGGYVTVIEESDYVML